MAIKLKRQQLYEDVWRTPAGKVSRKIGITSAKLREACNTMTIPMPPLDYWKSQRAGRKIAKPPLPPHSGPEEVWIGKDRNWAIHESEPAKSKQKTTRPPAPLSLAGNQPRLVPLAVWAAITFGQHAPHSNTLRAWVREGRIQPQPMKIGRRWWVRPDAEYQVD